MKGFKRVFMETKRFYLCMFLLVIFYVLLDCIYICNSNRIVSLDIEKQTRIEESLENQDAVSVFQGNIASIGGSIRDKGDYFEVFGIRTTIFLVILMLVVKEFAFMDVRTREFRSMWPVKNWIREIYNYFAMFSILIIAFVTQTVVLLLMQKRYNHMVMGAIGENLDRVATQSVMAAGERTVILYMLLYMLVVIFSYTWFYLGMSLARNPIVGIGLALVVKGMLGYICDTIYYDADVLFECVVNSQLYDYICTMVKKLTGVLTSMLYNSEIFYYYDDLTYWLSNYSDEPGRDMLFAGNIVLTMIVCLVILIVCIIIAAKKKELSKGKVFYFSLVDGLFSVLIGVALFIFQEEPMIYSDSWVMKNVAISLNGSVAVTFIVWVFLHPILVKQSESLEVK